MKFIHLADLHIGKRVNGFSMKEDQAYILEQILDLCRKEKPDAVLIAGDVYDRSIPSEEAVSTLDTFLTKLSDLNIPALIISGNHDSAGRLAFAARLLERSNVIISPVYDGSIRTVMLQDAFGPVAVHLIPFVRPAEAREALRKCSDGKVADLIQGFNAAVYAQIARIPLEPSIRNVAVVHQFVSGAEGCESDEGGQPVGTLDQVAASVFDGFDYVALGHLHRPQSINRETIRYAGSPLRYSFNELDHEKSVTIVELAEKGTVTLRTEPLTPLHDLRVIRGPFAELIAQEDNQHYIHAVLTDEDEIENARARLQTRYERLMTMDYDNSRTRAAASGPLDITRTIERTPLENFAALYKDVNGRDLSDAQTAYLSHLIDSIWEEADE